MKRKIIIIVSLIIIVMGLLSLYNTFAFNRDNENIFNSSSDISLSYSIKNTTKNIVINSNEEKYVDIKVKNTYSESVQYGIYYKIMEPSVVPTGLNVSVSDNSKNNSVGILDSGEEKVITVEMSNMSSYNVTLSLGNVVGFVNGDVTSLLDNNMILIK